MCIDSFITFDMLRLKLGIIRVCTSLFLHIFMHMLFSKLMQVVIYDSSLKIQPGEFLSNYIDMINDPEAWTRYTDVCELDRKKTYVNIQTLFLCDFWMEHIIQLQVKWRNSTYSDKSCFILNLTLHVSYAHIPACQVYLPLSTCLQDIF